MAGASPGATSFCFLLLVYWNVGDQVREETKMENVEIAPMRTLDDFLLESARFQLPAFKDPERVVNRIINNLLYYQTNYFLTAVMIFLIVG